MNRRDFDIDHIDPRWEDGRDYQLVCGLDCQTNLREEDRSVNAAKANRFLPWRCARNEIGVVPEEPGDLALFLVGADIKNDIPGEWVLMEFLSDEWFKATIGTCSRSYRKVDSEKILQGVNRWKADNPDKVKEQLQQAQQAAALYQQNNPDHFKKVQEKAKKWREENPEKVQENARKAIAVRFMCTVTGKVSRPGPLTQFQRKRGIDTINRVRVE